MRDRRSDENEGGSDERRDDLIRDALSPLKGVGMPGGVRTSTERRIQTALAEDVTCRSSGRTWWRRRVSVPIPVAAGFVLFLSVLGVLQLRQLSHRHTGDERAALSMPAPAAAYAGRPQYYEEALYVTGMGLVNSERGYRLYKESNHEI